MGTESPWAESVRWSCERIAGRSDRPVVGCTERDLWALQRVLGRPLPQAYVAFLTAVGRSPGDFLQGTHVGYDKLKFLQKNIPLVMSESGAKMPVDGFCFASNPSYAFLWFSLGDSEDPPVHSFEEGWRESKVVRSSFSGWLEGAVGEQWGVRRRPLRAKKG